MESSCAGQASTEVVATFDGVEETSRAWELSGVASSIQAVLTDRADTTRSAKGTRSTVGECSTFDAVVSGLAQEIGVVHGPVRTEATSGAELAVRDVLGEASGVDGTRRALGNIE